MTDLPKLKLGEDLFVDVVDPHHVQPVYADLVTEFRVVGGVVYVSFANLIVDGDDNTARKAQVCARLRIAPQTATFIQKLLEPSDQPLISSGQTLN